MTDRRILFFPRIIAVIIPQRRLNTLQKHFTVSCYIVHQSTKTVLLVHHKILNLWMGPGGHRDEREGIEEALVREILEETGIRNVRFLTKKHHLNLGRSREERIPNFIEIHPIPKDRTVERLHEHINLVYYATSQSKKVKVKDDEHHGIGWFTYKEAKKLPIDASSLYHIKQAIKLAIIS